MSNSIHDLIQSAISPKGKRGRKSKRKVPDRFLRKRTARPTDGYYHFKKTPEVFLGASDLDDFIQSNLVLAAFDNDENVFVESISAHTSEQKWNTHLANVFLKDHVIIRKSERSGILYQPKSYNHMEFYTSSNSSITIKIYGREDYVSRMKRIIETEFDIMNSYIDWMYSSDGNSIRVPLNNERLPFTEMYPFLKNETLEEYYERYINSPSSILLLIGPPGTGKTSFIRGLLAHTKSSAMVTYDTNILDKDQIFADFIENSTDFMVLEDSDNFLKSRSDGNSMMHRFLNVGDGLVTSKGKKLIFSTNLPSIRDVDSALIRPGRCFDILTFDFLNQDEAETLAEVINSDIDVTTKDKWTISEVFNKVQISPEEKSKSNRKFGFV